MFIHYKLGADMENKMKRIFLLVFVILMVDVFSVMGGEIRINMAQQKFLCTKEVLQPCISVYKKRGGTNCEANCLAECKKLVSSPKKMDRPKPELMLPTPRERVTFDTCDKTPYSENAYHACMGFCMSWLRVYSQCHQDYWDAALQIGFREELLSKEV